MKNNIQFNNGHQWTGWQKTAFRFFFIFLSLEVLTEDFLSILFKEDNGYKTWIAISGIFTQPCLWLNNRFFHFKYVPDSYITFTYALHSVRDVVYLLTAILACTIWTIADKKRPGYKRLHYWFSRCLVIILSGPIFFYGITKIFANQMPPPSFVDLQKQVGELSPFELAWTTFGYGQPFQVFTGFFELAGALLILFRRTRVAGLLIIAAVLINVIMIDYSFRVGNILVTAFHMLLVTLFLLTPYSFRLFQFFFTNQQVALMQTGYTPPKTFKTKLFTVITFLFIGSSFTANTLHAYNRYTRRIGIDQSASYSMIKNYIVDGDSLRPIENDTLRWRSWFERVRDGKRLVTISAMKSGTDNTYLIDRDSLKQTLTLHPFNQHDAASLNFNYKNIDAVNWCLEGTVRRKKIKIELQKINPDTMMKLLKLKRAVVFYNDPPNDE